MVSTRFWDCQDPPALTSEFGLWDDLLDEAPGMVERGLLQDDAGKPICHSCVYTRMFRGGFRSDVYRSLPGNI